MKKFLLIILLFTISQANAQSWVTIPDANFAAYLRTLVPTAMHNDSLNTSSAVVTTSIRRIDAFNKNISNLNGVQYFLSLDSLFCADNNLTTLPTLPPSLTILNCTSNIITSLPALPNTLTSLDCHINNLTSLPTLPSALKFFDCSLNNLTTLPALPYGLEFLYCQINHPGITGLPALPSTLKHLICSINAMTIMPALPNSLIELKCSYNNLTSLPTLPDSLQQLICYSNHITCFPNFPAAILPYSTNSGYNIELYNNPFTCLPNYLPLAMDSTTLAYPLCTAGNTNGCAVAADISTYNAQHIISIYPNPAQNYFTVKTNSNEKQTLQLFDIIGKQVLLQTINGTTQIDVSQLIKGVYFYSIIQNQQNVQNGKLIIE